MVVLPGCSHVGKDDKDIFVAVKCQAVGSELVDEETELFHVDLEGFSSIKRECEHTDSECNHFFFGGTFDGCCMA